MSTNDSQSLAQQTTLHLLDEVRAGNEAAVSLLYKRHLGARVTAIRAASALGFPSSFAISS